LVDHTGERWWEAELYRLKGELLRQSADFTPHVSEAVHCFQRAIEIAHDQGAKAWELRAIMSLSRIWQRQGKQDAAWSLLHGIYRQFTEGFDTADLQDAKVLLAQLASG
jgi:predicted ATPase